MFKLTRPCNNCPFRKGIGETFQLHPARLKEIKRAVAFQCHATVDYEARGGISTSLLKRFWEKVDKRGPRECWNWTAALDARGYGAVGRGGRGEGVAKAHRISWEIHYGFEPIGFDVCHSCDNPACVNPGHLWLGDNDANHKDKVAKGRGTSTQYRTLSDDEVDEIRERYEGDETLSDIARAMGCSVSHVHNIVKFKSRNASINDKPQQCAGLMSILHREGYPNQIMQLGERLKWFDPSKLDPDREAYDTWADVLAAHIAGDKLNGRGRRTAKGKARDSAD